MRVESDDLVIVLDGPLGQAEVIVGHTTIHIDVGILRVESDGLVIILDGPLGLAEAIVDQAPVHVNAGIQVL